MRKPYVLDNSDDDEEESTQGSASPTSSSSSSGNVKGISTQEGHAPPEAGFFPAAASRNKTNIDLKPWFYPPLIYPELVPSPGLLKDVENDYSKSPTPSSRPTITNEAMARRKYSGFPIDVPSDDEADEDFKDQEDDYTESGTTRKRARFSNSGPAQQKTTVDVVKSSKPLQTANTQKAKPAVPFGTSSVQDPAEKRKHKVKSRVVMTCIHCGWISGLFWRDQDTKIHDYCESCLRHRGNHSKFWDLIAGGARSFLQG
jgi:hypothetical protein